MPFFLESLFQVVLFSTVEHIPPEFPDFVDFHFQIRKPSLRYDASRIVHIYRGKATNNELRSIFGSPWLKNEIWMNVSCLLLQISFSMLIETELPDRRIKKHRIARASPAELYRSWAQITQASIANYIDLDTCRVDADPSATGPF